MVLLKMRPEPLATNQPLQVQASLAELSDELLW
jgi:hypothetical protein